MLIFIALGMLLYFAIGWVLGDFRKCLKCGSRLTTYHFTHTPDTSHGSSIMHDYAYRRCMRCKHKQAIVGIEVKS